MDIAKQLRLEAAAGFNEASPETTAANIRGVMLKAAAAIESLQHENAELKSRLSDVLDAGTRAQVEALKANEERHAIEGIVEEYRNVDRKHTAHIARLQRELEEARKESLEEAAKICDEMGEHWAGYKDTALLNGDVALSNAASGEPRAAEFLAKAIRDRIDAARNQKV